jgi:hypothetical protein
MTVILPIPRIDPMQIEEYFYKEFYEIIKNEEIKPRMPKGFLSLNKLCNLRNTKRVLGTFKLLYRDLVGEVDVVDFICIVYLYIFFPQITEEIYKKSINV